MQKAISIPPGSKVIVGSKPTKILGVTTCISSRHKLHWDTDKGSWCIDRGSEWEVA